MKNINLILVCLISFLVFLLFNKDIEYVEKTKVVYKDTIIKGKTDTIYITKPKPYKVVEIKIDTVYMDSASILNKLKDLNKLRSYSITHKDSLIDIKTDLTVIGRMDTGVISYNLRDFKLKTKETLVEKIKTPTISLFGGAGVGSYRDLNIHLGVFNKKNVFQVELSSNKKLGFRYSRIFLTK